MYLALFLTPWMLMYALSTMAMQHRDLFAYAYDVTPYHVPLGRQLTGTGDDALRQLEHLQEELGVEEVFLWHHANCFDPGAELEAITEFGENTGRRSSTSAFCRTNSNPDVVTMTQLSGWDG